MDNTGGAAANTAGDRSLELMRRRIIGTARLAVGISASAGLGWLAIRGLDWGEVASGLGSASPSLLAIAVIVFMLASYLRAVRWRILFTTESISTRRLFIIQNEGIGVNNLIPVRVASEITQLAVLTLRDGVNKATALATLGMERIIDVVASTFILAVAFFLVPEMKEFSPYMWAAFAATLLLLGIVRFVSWSSGALAFVGRLSFLSALATAVRDLERERARLFGSFAISVAYWLLVGISAWIIAKAVDLPMSPLTATLVIMGTIFFATVVPAAPSAIGTFEWAVVYVLAFFGIERAAGFGYAIIIHAVFFLPPTIIAVLFLPREGVVSLGGVRRLALAAVGGGRAQRA